MTSWGENVWVAADAKEVHADQLGGVAAGRDITEGLGDDGTLKVDVVIGNLNMRVSGVGRRAY